MALNMALRGSVSMMQMSKGQETSELDIKQKVADDEATTEEEANSAVDENTSESEGELLSTVEDTLEGTEQDAMRQYADRFGRNSAGASLIVSSLLKSNAQPTSDVDALCDKMSDQMQATLDRELNLSEVASHDVVSIKETFGYAGSLDVQPPFAKFDIRAEVCTRVGGFGHGQVVRDRNGNELIVVGVKVVDGEPRLWFQPKSLGRPGAGAFKGTSLASLHMRVQAVEGNRVEPLSEMQLEDFVQCEDSDGEDMVLCEHCQLPVGCNCYLVGDSQDVHVHGECFAQQMLQDLKKEDLVRQQKDADTKNKLRADYGIGWKVSEVPSNITPVMKLDCGFAHRGMCCVVYNEEKHAVEVAPTLEPAESINLEYLSLALQVRVLEGREPMFSLDPVIDEGERKKEMMQAKCFEPEWLAGTSVGEVLFQADYHLKELSMGQYEQPVIGMKSCIDMSDAAHSENWNAREWFVVRNADVLMTQDNVLVPQVKMGVEAREQVVSTHGLEDKSVTRANHPLVQYAEQFTHYFDLIAERKSVIYHLRDLAKAAVMAKLMVEADVNAEGPWLDLASDSKEVSSLEVPQLWNHLLHTQVHVHSNQIVSAADKARSHGVYGGVQFGLDKVMSKPHGASVMARPAVAMSAIKTPSLGITARPKEFSKEADVAGPVVTAPAAKAVATKPRITAAKGTPMPSRKVGMATISEKPTAIFTHGVTPTAFSLVEGKPVERAGVSAARFMAMPTSRTPLMPLAGASPKPSVAIAPIVPPRPELRGVDLNLDQFSFSEPTLVTGMPWAADQDVKCASLGKSFWSSLESGSDFYDDAKALLKIVFNPKLSDRREEGERFVPPETSYDYVKSLSKLVEEEQQICEQRRQHFLSQDFSVSNPGPLFPKSWVPSVALASEKGQERQLYSQPDCISPAVKFAPALKSTPPIFEKVSEDGVSFRIYRIGKLEVRTTKEFEGQEVVGAVFSTNAQTHPDEGQQLNELETIVKVMEYVEKVHGARCSYVVLETQNGSTIVTQKLKDGTVTWSENPADCTARNSLAKLIRSADCEVTVGCMKNFYKEERQLPASTSECKRYAQATFTRAIEGKSGNIYTGFRKGDKKMKWQLM